MGHSRRKKSASDHNIIKFNITSIKDEGRVTHDPGRLRIKGHQYAEFYEKLQRLAPEIFQFEDRGRSNENLDETLTQKLEATREVHEFTEKLEEVIQKASMETRGNGIKAKQKEKRKTVPWWRNGLTRLRKKTNAMRRYQWTTGNEILRGSRRKQYNKAKVEY